MSDKLTPDGSGGFHLPDGGRLIPDGMDGYHILNGGSPSDGCAAGLTGILAVPMAILCAIVSVLVAPSFIILPIVALLTQGMLGRPLTPDEGEVIFTQGFCATAIFWAIVIFFVIKKRMASKK